MEFALVFSVFFLLVYGLLTYGIIFTAQASLNFSAQEAARSVLQWQADGTAGLVTRAQSAVTLAQTDSNWVTTMGQAGLEIAVCNASGVLSSANGGACSGATLQTNQVEVVIQYPYGSSPLVPELPGFGLLAPTQLNARAAIVVDAAFAAPADS